MTQNKALNGELLNEPKIVSYDPLAVVFKTVVNGEVTNCYLVSHALTFLYQAQPTARIALYGHFNKRHQFVVHRFMISQNKTSQTG